MQTGHHLPCSWYCEHVQMFDMFVLETYEDAQTCANAGVLDIVLFELECENCSMSVGPAPGDLFIPVAIVTDQRGVSWPICVDCAAPMIFPGDWYER